MPFYGRLDYLQASVGSVLAQTSPDWRLVVVDDHYPDPAPGEWVRSLGDSRVVHVRNEANLGVTGNFNRCVDLAESSHAMLVGFDDLLRPDFVARMLELIERAPDAAMIQPGVAVVDESGVGVRPLADRIKSVLRPRRPGEYAGERLATSLMHGNWAYFPAMVWRTDALRRHRFRAEHWVVQDVALMLDIITEGGSMLVDDEVTFDYRRHVSSVSGAGASSGAIFEDERAIFAAAEARFRERGWRRAARAARLHATSRLHAAAELPSALRSGDRAGVRSLLRHALR